MKPRIFVVGLFAVATVTAQQPTFEVASIKPSDPQPMGRIMTGMNSDTGMVRYTYISLKDCIRTAYRVKDFQVKGPEWLDSVRFDITAKLPAGAKEADIPEMLQTLLAERFKLTVRRDTSEHAIYALVAGKGGPKLKPAEIQTGGAASPAMGSDGKPRRAMMMQMGPDGAHLRAESATLASLAELMSRFSERPVVDVTGIEGQYQFDLTFMPETMPRLPGGPIHQPTPDAPPPTSAATMFDAMQQYGLRLEPQKTQMPVIIVTHAEKAPTEN
jgi:uncharacterized protein (TIGR03435 family)